MLEVKAESKRVNRRQKGLVESRKNEKADSNCGKLQPDQEDEEEPQEGKGALRIGLHARRVGRGWFSGAR